MLKLFHAVFSLMAVIFITASSAVCFGQTPTSYVLRNDSLVRENARIIVDSLLKTEDEVTRVPYVEATVKAFDRYWSKARVNFDWKSLDRIQSDINDIEGKISECDSLQRQLNGELSNAQKVILDKDNVTINEADVMGYLRDRIGQLQQQSDSLSQQIESVDQTLSERKETLSERTEELESKSSSTDDVSQAFVSADILIEIVTRVKDGLATDIVTVNTEDLNQAQDLNDRYIDIIGTISPEKYTLIVEGMGEIMPYLPLVDVINRSTRAMGGKFDAELNQQLADEITSLLSGKKSSSLPDGFPTKLLTASQKAQSQAIVTSLVEQENSAKNLNYLLDFILKQNPEGTKAASYDVSSDIAKIVNIVNPAQQRYNQRYTNLNNILDALEAELKATDFTVEELQKYIAQKKGQI